MDVHRVIDGTQHRNRKYWTEIQHGKPVRARVTPKVLARIFQRVEPDERGCWPWPGAKDQKGYAEVSIDGKARRVSRVMVQTFIRSLRNGEDAHHNDWCRNPRCINPKHLAPLDKGKNTADGNHNRRTERMKRMLAKLVSKMPANDPTAKRVRKYLARLPHTHTEPAPF